MADRVVPRFYICGRREIYEWRAPDGTLLHTQSYSSGFTITDFLYLDFMDLFGALQRADSLSSLEEALAAMARAHPCLFTLLERGPQAEYSAEIGRLLELVFVWQDLQKKLEQFMEACLTPDPKPGTQADRYLLFCARSGGFSCRQPHVEWDLTVGDREDGKAADSNLRAARAGGDPNLPPPEDLPVTLSEIVSPANAEECIVYFAMRFLRDGTRFKRCKYCGRYFALAGSANADYCERPCGDTGKTCREIGAIRRYQSKKAEDPISRLYTKAYKKYFAWIKYGKFTKEEFTAWSVEARKKRDACLAGELSFEAFQTWLNVRQK